MTFCFRKIALQFRFLVLFSVAAFPKKCSVKLIFRIKFPHPRKSGDTMSLPIKAENKGSWVQTERKAHEDFAILIGKNPKAASIMHLLVARMGDHNAVVISQKTLAKLLGCTDRTVRTAMTELVAGNWIEVRQIGERGTVNAYIVNDRVAWTGSRDGIRYSLFSATVVVSSDEQPPDQPISTQALRRLPSLFAGERQLPTGDGLPPPSQPTFDGFEPDLPAKKIT
jgi:hypothetical protein